MLQLDNLKGLNVTKITSFLRKKIQFKEVQSTDEPDSYKIVFESRTQMEQAAQHLQNDDKICGQSS